MSFSASVPDAGRQLAAADLEPGQVVAKRNVLLSASSFEAFAVLTGDAHPIHYSEAYARGQGLRAPIAHGLLLIAITALGATPLSAQLHDSMVAMVGTEADFLSPVFVEDEVEVRVIVGAIQPKSNNRSLVTFNIEVISPNQTVHARVRHRFILRTSLEVRP